MKKLAALACGGALVAGGLVAASPASPAGAATVQACVKKKTGDIRFLTGTKKRKCKKGWKRISWNQQGAQGPQGPQGPQGTTGAVGPKLVVKDSAGNVLGPLASVYPVSGSYFSILINGGVYLYEPGGKVVPLTSPVYKTADCSGIPYLDASSSQSRDLYTASAGSSARFVYRSTDPTFGAISSFAFTAVSEDHTAPAPAITLYDRNSAGTCVVDDAAFNGYLVQLAQEVTPPRDATGRLTLVEE